MQKVASRKGGDAFTVDFGPSSRQPRRAADAGPRGSTSASARPVVGPGQARRRSAGPPGTMASLPSEAPAAAVSPALGSTTTSASSTPSQMPFERSAAQGAGRMTEEASSMEGTPVVPGPNDNFQVGEPHDMSWVYRPPPNNQRTKTFVVDAAVLPPTVALNCPEGSMKLTFDSNFDSGNMIDVVQRGPLSYEIHTASDCQNSPQELANKAWWYFSIRGLVRGVTLSLTVAAVPYCKSFSFGYAPVVACVPVKPSFARIANRVSIVPAANPPPPRPTASAKVPNDDGDDAAAPAPTKKKSNNPSHVDISFDFTFEHSDESIATTAPQRVMAGVPVTYCFANTFPYSYARLQRHLAAWAPHCQATAPLGRCATHAPDPPALVMRPPPSSGAATASSSAADSAVGAATPHIAGTAPCRIYTHREVLNLTPDGNRVDVLTITSGAGLANAIKEDRREALFSELHPLSSASTAANAVTPQMSEHRQILLSPDLATKRPYAFPDREYVVFSARVHPGEVPASHILHGVIEMLLSATDPRAEALRQHFVFVIVPMLNPDGVARGHSRADPVGQNLNRLYKDPHPLKQPTCLALRNLLLSLQRTRRLALYVDMHAHSNKKGAFLFGNAMDAVPQVQNLLYAKLGSLNSPYLDFPSCNFSEGNMYAVGKGGGGKDGSSRVMLFNETGFTHSYTLEMNYITGPPINGVAKLNNIPGEEYETVTGTPCVKYCPPIFHDVGRGLLAALLDLKSFNPASRLPLTTFKHLRGVALWIQRALLVDAWEQQRRQQALATGMPLSVALGTTSMATGELGFSPCAPNELPFVVTTRPSAAFPPTTTRNLADLAATYSASSVTGPEPGAHASVPRSKPKPKPKRGASFTSGTNGVQRGTSKPRR